MTIEYLLHLVLSNKPFFALTYPFDRAFFRFIFLTVKTLHRITILGFLIDATKPKKHTLKRVQQRSLGS